MIRQNCNTGTDTHTCMNCRKKVNSLFDELEERELAVLERHRSVVNYKRGELIYKEGSKSMGLLCLNEGKVKLVKRGKNDNEQIISLKRPVDFIDLRSTIASSEYNHSAYALEDASVCFIEKNDFLKVLNGNSQLALKIIRMLSAENDVSTERLFSNSWKHLRARLAEAILLLKEFYGTLEDGRTINYYIKRTDLAGLSNMNPANVIRTIASFTKEDLLVSEKKRIIIKNEKALRRVSEQEEK